jgi:hypothetical protein
LPRFDDYFPKALLELRAGRNLAGVSEEQERTIDRDELGIPLPAGMSEQEVAQFPTPGKAIRKMKDANRKKMLERL